MQATNIEFQILIHPISITKSLVVFEIFVQLVRIRTSNNITMLTTLKRQKERSF